MNYEDADGYKPIVKVILTHCDLDDKPDDPSKDDYLLKVIKDLNLEWNDDSTKLKNTEEIRKVIKMYKDYHKKEAEVYEKEINKLCNTELG